MLKTHDGFSAELFLIIIFFIFCLISVNLQGRKCHESTVQEQSERLDLLGSLPFVIANGRQVLR